MSTQDKREHKRQDAKRMKHEKPVWCARSKQCTSEGKVQRGERKDGKSWSDHKHGKF